MTWAQDEDAPLPDDDSGALGVPDDTDDDATPFRSSRWSRWERPEPARERGPRRRNP